VAKLVMQQLITQPERRLDLKVKVERNLDRIEHMIRNLLDANRIQAGQRLPLRLESCDLAAICMEVAEELNNERGSGRVVLVAEERPWGWWSAEEIRRALWNLVSNAINYGSPDRPVVVTLQQKQDSVEIGVFNEGHGIPAEEQALLFEPYRRRDGDKSDRP